MASRLLPGEVAELPRRRRAPGVTLQVFRAIGLGLLFLALLGLAVERLG